MFVQNRILLSCCFALVAAVAVSGCGGGDGVGGGMHDLIRNPDVRNQAPALSRKTQDATSNNPRYGSVVQSSNAVSGVAPLDLRETTDDVDVRLTRDAGGEVRFTVEKTATEGNGVNWEVTQDDVYRGTETGTGEDNSVGFEASTRDNADDGTVYVDFYSNIAPSEETSNTDWLAGGVWLYIPDDAAKTDSVEIGAFGEGGDPFVGTLATATGTAVYEGQATGIYVASYTIKPMTEEYDGEVGYFDADVTLEANFDSSVISGTVENYMLETPSDGVLRLDGETILNGATIEEDPRPGIEGLFFDGYVGAADVNGQPIPSTLSGITADGTAYNINMSERGRWGGQFFGNDEADGVPGSVGGTFGATGTSVSGDGATRYESNLSLVGSFGAERE